MALFFLNFSNKNFIHIRTHYTNKLSGLELMIITLDDTKWGSLQRAFKAEAVHAL